MYVLEEECSDSLDQMPQSQGDVVSFKITFTLNIVDGINAHRFCYSTNDQRTTNLFVLM